MIDCVFNLTRWCAISTHLYTQEAWQQWAKNELNWQDLPSTQPELSFLPALQRRRLSLSARLMFQVAHTLLESSQTCPIVFVSHDGEINRSFQLYQTLWREHSVSPTSFGLSVHNALVGQWSLLRGDMSENTALSAQQDGWEWACIEAISLLHEGASHVLVLSADEPLHTSYTVDHALRAPFAYAVGALISQGDNCTLSRIATQNHDSYYWGALTWVKQKYLAQHDFIQSYSQTAWQWHVTH